MTHCVKCGSPLDEAATACSNCGWGTERNGGDALRKRPDGTSLMGFGWCALVFGLLFSLIAMFPTSNYDGGYVIRTYHWGWVMLGGGLLNLGLLLLLAGFIIRAIWFLPGPDYKPAPGTRTRRPEPTATSPLTRPGGEGAQI